MRASGVSTGSPYFSYPAQPMSVSAGVSVVKARHHHQKSNAGQSQDRRGQQPHHHAKRPTQLAPAPIWPTTRAHAHQTSNARIAKQSAAADARMSYFSTSRLAKFTFGILNWKLRPKLCFVAYVLNGSTVPQVTLHQCLHDSLRCATYSMSIKRVTASIIYYLF